MKRTVDLSEQAHTDIQQATAFIAEHSPRNADKWLLHLLKLIDELPVMPHSYAIAREANDLQTDLRQAIFKSHRVIFEITPDRIFIVRIVHAAKQDFQLDTDAANPQDTP